MSFYPLTITNNFTHYLTESKLYVFLVLDIHNNNKGCPNA
jgi:hypothetical protein